MKTYISVFYPLETILSFNICISHLNFFNISQNIAKVDMTFKYETWHTTIRKMVDDIHTILLYHVSSLVGLNRNINFRMIMFLMLIVCDLQKNDIHGSPITKNKSASLPTFLYAHVSRFLVSNATFGPLQNVVIY